VNNNDANLVAEIEEYYPDVLDIGKDWVKITQQI